MRSTLWILLISLVGTMLPAVSAAAQTSQLGALSDGFTANSEIYTLSEESRIYVVADQEPTGSLLQTVQLLQRQFAADSRPAAAPMPMIWGPESWVCSGDLVISLEPDCGIGEDGYLLQVTDIAKVTASDVDGLLYGGNMLLKHLRNAGSNSVQGFTAADTPDTAQRAVSLDCGRKYYTKDWICNFIREISWMGYNTLELHFSDDSGFRIDIWDEAYYTDTFHPANDFSWICGSNYTSWTLSAYKNDPDKGKYLTTAEVVEILNTAKEYHIDVIPAFDSPSHLDYTTWTYEQNYKSDPSYSFYSTYDEKTYYAKDVNGIINYTNSSGWSTPLRWPYYSTVNVVSDHAKAFVFELYLDIADFFKTYAGSTDFSIGADEVNLDTGNLASGYSFTWGFSDFVDYINELNGLLNDKGYTMRMYNDFMGSTAYNASGYDFAENIEILYWDSPFEPNSGGPGTSTEPVSYYVNKGSTIYNCIQTNTYYALRITGSGSDARSVYNRQWTFYHANEEDIYNEWYPADISEHGDYSEDTEDVPEENLGGAYFLIWCDYSCVSTEVQIWNGCYDATTQNTGEFYSLRDRMWSNITKMWNWDINETVDYSAFASVRDAYGAFPGCGTTVNACSEKTELPAATPISSGYAGECMEYACYGQIRILKDTPVMSLPCGEAVEPSSAQRETAYAQELYTAIRLYENSVGELWYKVRTKTGSNGYLQADATEFVSTLTDDLTVTDIKIPSGHVQGQDFSLGGDIQSQHNLLTSVGVWVYDGLGMDGTLLTGCSASVTDNTYTLADSDIENKITFDQLSLGEHTYAVTADYQSCYVLDGQVTEHSETVCLLEEYFMVLQTAADQDTCSHSYVNHVLHPASCEEQGVQVNLCAVCGHVYEEVIPSTGHFFQQTSLPATCTEYETVRYTCSVCDHSYDTYPDSVYSQWQETKPEGIGEELIQSKEVYRYSDYETVVSGEPVLEGYTQLGSDWQKQSASSVSYVSSWPSGFNTASSLYTTYNNKAQKVTAFETETTKRVIDSDQVSGYLYYHWCYANSYYSASSKTGSYTTFHAYYSTVAPSNYVCDYSDMSYRTYHSSCSNSQWFFATSVNTQQYTDYVKQYQHGRWSDWSDWSDTPVSAGDSRKVETKPLYRYVNGSFGDHRWDGNVCLECGAFCEHIYETVTVAPGCITDGSISDRCVNCGHMIKKETVPATGHSHEPVTTAPTCTEMGYTTYTCACGDSYVTDEVAALGHSYDTVTVDATCTTDGSITDTCATCGDVQIQVIPAAGHDYKAKITAPTCIEIGYTTYTCHCGDSYTADEVMALGHSYERVTVDATCTADGSITDTCVACGDVQIQVVPATGHHYEVLVDAPTCTDRGYTTYTCTCGDSYVTDEVAALGHSYERVTVDATCTADGSITDTCAACGDVQIQVIPAAGHDYKAEITVPTCTEIGYTTYTCHCGDSYTADEVMALGHSYERMTVDATCTTDGSITDTCAACGDVQVQVIPATGHSHQAEVTLPGCTESGYTTYTCHCGDSYVADLTDALGHSYEVAAVAPDCVIPGYTAHVCGRCGYSYYDNIVPALGHHYEAVVTEPTYTDPGYTTYTCDRCADSYIAQVTRPIGHDYTATVVPSTCTTAGYTLYACTCGYSYTADPVEALGHSYENGSCTVCGAADPDYDPGVTVPTLTLKAPALEFKDMVKVIAFFTAENTEDVVEMGMVTYSSQVSAASVETADHVIPGAILEESSGRYFASSQGINAKYLGDTVYLACYAKLTDGSYVYTKVAPYGAVQYATNQLKNSTDMKLKQLVAAMLNYGAAAQNYFGYNTDVLANASLTDEQIALPETYFDGMVSTVPAADAAKQGIFANNKGFSQRKPAVSFEGAFSINYFFTPAHTPADGVTLYYWTEADFNATDVLTVENASGAVTMSNEGDNLYRGDITDIAAKNIANAVYVAAVYSDGTTTWTSGVLGYSIGAYCASMAKGTDTMADLAKATAVYGYHAKQYFG